jgi:hypothetical protein
MSNGKRKFPPIALVIFCFSLVVCADGMASDIKIIEAAKKEGGEIDGRGAGNYEKHLDEFRNYFGK